MGIQYHTRIANVTYIHVPRYQYRYGTGTGTGTVPVRYLAHARARARMRSSVCARARVEQRVRARACMDRRSNCSVLLVLFLIPLWLRSVTPSPHAARAQRLTQLRAGPRVSQR